MHAAPRLKEFYADPYNQAMMTNTHPLSASEIAAFYSELIDEGGRPLLLYRDGELVGDGDLRGIHDGHAEATLLIGQRSLQGKNLGTLFGAMVLALGCRHLGIEHFHAVYIPENTASARWTQKLGYLRDDSSEARRWAEDDREVVVTLTRTHFEQLHRETLKNARFFTRHVAEKLRESEQQIP